MTAVGEHFWWATSATEWHDNDSADIPWFRDHHRRVGGVDMTAMEAMADDGRRFIVEGELEVEFDWTFKLDEPADQAACVAALRDAADVLERIACCGFAGGVR